jgi:hypothetical protein
MGEEIIPQGMFSPPLTSGVASLHVGFTGATTQSLVLGDHLYTVSISPLFLQAGGNLSTIGSLPFVSPNHNEMVSVQVSDVPEPSTLALAAAALGVRAWRRRRRVPQPAA